MISPNDMGIALITKLKADTTLVNWLSNLGCGNEIREVDYQGDTFLYPNVRVDAGTITPLDDGVCHDTSSRGAFRIYCYSEQNSSYQCSELVELVYNALNGKQLNGTGFSSSRMVADSLTKPTRSPNRVWSAIIPFTVMLFEES